MVMPPSYPASRSSSNIRTPVMSGNFAKSCWIKGINGSSLLRRKVVFPSMTAGSGPCSRRASFRRRMRANGIAAEAKMSGQRADAPSLGLHRHHLVLQVPAIFNIKRAHDLSLPVSFSARPVSVPRLRSWLESLGAVFASALPRVRGPGCLQ